MGNISGIDVIMGELIFRALQMTPLPDFEGSPGPTSRLSTLDPRLPPEGGEFQIRLARDLADDSVQ
jgi:hypothetical protein